MKFAVIKQTDIVTIFICPDIGVLIIRKVDTPPPGSTQIESELANRKSSLFVSDDIDQNSNSLISRLVEKIFEESGAAIENRNYSRNGQTMLSCTNKLLEKKLVGPEGLEPSTNGL
jgi:hypothetical protein